MIGGPVREQSVEGPEHIGGRGAWLVARIHKFRRARHRRAERTAGGNFGLLRRGKGEEASKLTGQSRSLRLLVDCLSKESIGDTRKPPHQRSPLANGVRNLWRQQIQGETQWHN